VGGEDAGGDPFDQWRFDEDFVRAAAVSEASAEERVERLRRIDADHHRVRTQRELDQVSRHPSRGGRRRRSSRHHRDFGRWQRPFPRISTLLIIGTTVVVGIWAVKDGFMSDESAQSFFGGGSGQVVDGDSAIDVPAPPADERDHPLGAPAAVPPGEGPHAFMQLQPGSTEPVAYDPCQPIHYVVNWATAPTDEAADLLDAGLAEITRATGLQFVFDGSTPELPSYDRALVQDRYGDRWAPVLISWSDSAELPELSDDVGGAAGSVSIATNDGRSVYVTGVVTLDGPDLIDVARRSGDDGVIAATILHELGHLVGLAHVEDETQIMNPYSVPGVVAFGTGDLAGLAELGRGDCFAGV